MTITNSAFGFGNKSLEGYDLAYLVAPDMPEVERLVTAEQVAFRESVGGLVDDKFPQTYERARSIIESYARTCSFSGMRQLVSKSMADRTNKLNGETTSDAKPVVAPVVGATPVSPPPAAALANQPPG